MRFAVAEETPTALVFTHDVENTDQDAIAQSAITFNVDQLPLLIAHDAIAISKANKFDKTLVVSSNADRFLQRVKIIFERRNPWMLSRFYHQYCDFFCVHITTSKK